MQSITERVHIEKRYGPRRQSLTPDDDGEPRNNSHTPPPPYSSMPFSSPPPRYVSVIGLDNDQQQHSKKNAKKKVNKEDVEKPDPKAAPVNLRSSSFVEDEEDSSGGLPTYDEALNIEQEDSIVTVQGGSSMRVSMV